MNPAIEAIAQTAIFLFSVGANPQPIGTAFIVGVPYPAHPGMVIPFVVTAKHVIGDRDRVAVRYSRGDSAATALVEYDLRALKADSDYFPHPEEGVDIVVFRTKAWKEIKTEIYPVELLATKDTFRTEFIGITDRILFPSLLVNFTGLGRNYPVMRSGSIALIPDEKVPMEYSVGGQKIVTQQEVIFLNAVSMPGASGSPVLLDPGPRSQNSSFTLGSKPYLLGVMHGFFNASPREVGIAQTTAVTLYYQENSGIAIVFPSWRILEIFESPEFKARLSAIIAEEEKNATIQPSSPIIDATPVTKGIEESKPK